MAFNPLGIFKEKAKTKEAPPRGQGGKFVSAKKIVSYPITFYGHEIRRYYKEGEWYFALDDIAACAQLSPEGPNIRKGNSEKLSHAKEQYATKIDGVEVAKPKDIAKFIPYFKGNMPGPITDWLNDNSDLPLPSNESNS